MLSNGPANPPTPSDRRLDLAADALRFCLQRRNLRRTSRIALIVGLVLTAINQGSVIASGHATAMTWLRCALNFVVPLIVSNAGLLSGRARPSGDGATPGPRAAGSIPALSGREPESE